MPRGVRQTVAQEHVGALPPFDMGTGEGADIEMVEQIKMEQLELERFMQEPVSILIAEAPDDNATPCVEVSINGRRLILPRGTETTIPRCYVERLARAKRTVISQDLGRTDESLNRVTRRQVMDYPFSVIADPNPKGAEWLKRILAQA